MTVAGRSRPARVQGLGAEKGWIGSLGAAGCSANSGYDFGSSSATSGLCAPPYTGGPQSTKINLDRHRGGLRALGSLRGGLSLPVADLSILHPLMGTSL